MPDDHLGELLEDIPPTRSALLAERGYPPQVVNGTRPELSDLPLRQQRARLRSALDIDQGDEDDGAPSPKSVTPFPISGDEPEQADAELPSPLMQMNRQSAEDEDKPSAGDANASGDHEAHLAPAVEASPACSICGQALSAERARQHAATCDKRECQLERKRRRDEATKKQRAAAASSNGSGEHALLAPEPTNGAGAVRETSGHNGASNGHTGRLGQVLESPAGQRPAEIALPAHAGAPMAALAAGSSPWLSVSRWHDVLAPKAPASASPSVALTKGTAHDRNP